MTINLPNGLTISAIAQRSARLLHDEIFAKRCYARHVSINPHDVVFDVGANIGMFALWLDSLNLQGLRVWCFEPIPDLVECLRANLANAAIAHSIAPIALGESNSAWADFTFYPRAPECSTRFPEIMDELAPMARRWIKDQEHTLSGPVRMMTAMLPGAAKNWLAERVRRHHLAGVKRRCPVMTLSRVFYLSGLKKIDLLKIDTEGSERAILAGIHDEDWPRIQQIVVECHGGYDDTNRIAEMLRFRGYRVVLDCNPGMPELPMLYGVKL